MDGMFSKSCFNGDIASWDVSNVTYMSSMFSGSQFNQDLSNWNVDNAHECSGFSYNTPYWTLPKPMFINCDPDK